MIPPRAARRTVLMALGIILAGSTAALAQNEPFVVHDTKPVVMHGPYLASVSETSATVVWFTDTPCHAKVVYRSGSGPEAEADDAVHGLLPVGTRHVVHLTGLEPGREYAYRAVSTRVVKMKAYWPEKGLSVESPEAVFTTWDRRKAAVSFAAVADTHEDAKRVDALLKMTDRGRLDFLVHLGDAFHGLENEDQAFSRWFDPAARLAAGALPLLFVRGNHEMRGALARGLFDFTPVPEDRFYYARDHGPLHLIVLDTGEDKPDETNVYARLNKVKPYREREWEWLKAHLASDPRVKQAPFLVILIHQPNWGWTGDQGARWTEIANRAGVDLAIGGHFHKTSISKAGEFGRDFPVLILGQDQIAFVEASSAEIRVTVKALDGTVVQTLAVPARR